MGDQEAHCFFEELYEHFRVQPCYTGVTPECNATLQAFACYESFKRCDEQGFYTGTCRDECAGVTYECANNFETVDLEHYNCSSARYVDGHSETCTGGRAFNTLMLTVNSLEMSLIFFSSKALLIDSTDATLMLPLSCMARSSRFSLFCLSS